MMVFADTSALYALADTDDAGHLAVERAWQEMADREESVTTSNYVILETLSLLQRRLGMQAVRDFIATVLPAITVEWVVQELHDAAVRSLLAAGRRDLSPTDCVSFVFMRRRGIRASFTRDRHFREQGFACLPDLPASG